MNVLLLCRKFKKDKSMKKGRFSLLGIVALFLGLILDHLHFFYFPFLE